MSGAVDGGVVRVYLGGEITQLGDEVCEVTSGLKLQCFKTLCFSDQCGGELSPC